MRSRSASRPAMTAARPNVLSSTTWSCASSGPKPVAVNRWGLQHRSQQNRLQRSPPAEEHARQHEWQNVEVVENVVQYQHVRRHHPIEDRQYDHQDHDQECLCPRRAQAGWIGDMFSFSHAGQGWLSSARSRGGAGWNFASIGRASVHFHSQIVLCRFPRRFQR